MSHQADLLVEPPAPAAPVRLDTPHARLMLRKRFAAPEWALLEEVAPRTGGGTRYADAVAMNLWSSRGHALYGFEIKVSRSDWQRELRAPAKTEESVFAFCDRWYIVAPAGVVKDGELPTTWGLLELRAGGLFEKVAGKALEPKPLTRAFFASLMRRGHEQLDALAEQKVRLTVMEANARSQKYIDEEIARRTRQDSGLRDQIAKFEKDTGLTFSEYSGPPITTIKLAQHFERLPGWRSHPGEKLAHMAAELERAAAVVREAIDSTGLTPAPKDSP